MMNSETDTEDVLRRIYDGFIPPPKGMMTPRRQERPITISTPNKVTSKHVYIKSARVPTSMIEQRELNETLGKYKITRIQYMPEEEDTHVDAVVAAVAP